MTAGMVVNTGQVELQELRQGERCQRVFHMEVSKAHFLFTLFVLVFSVADCVLPLAFSTYCYDDSSWYNGYYHYDNYCYTQNYILIWIGGPIAVVAGLIFMLTKSPSVGLCFLYLIAQTIATILIVIANIYYMSNYAHTGQLFGAIIINICFFILLLLELKVIIVLIRQKKAANRLARDGHEIRVITQGQAFAAPPPPRPPQPTVPVTNGANGPVTTTTIITTYNAAPGQPVVIPPGIPAIHGIPPGPLNPAALANNQVYARTTSNMYPTVPQLGQMAPAAPVHTTTTATFATATSSDNMFPSAPPQLYDYPPEFTVATVHYQNAANPEEQYDMPPGLVDDHEEPTKERLESETPESERPDSPSPSDFSEVPSSSYDSPPDEGSSSSHEAPKPLPRKTRPSDVQDAPSVDQYEAPPVEEDETPIFL